ncbi:MAG: hypothetical protein ACE5I1_23780 [bacterium]
MVVHGALNAITLQAALTDAFIFSRDDDGRRIIAAEYKKEWPERLADLCSSSFRAAELHTKTAARHRRSCLFVE